MKLKQKKNNISDIINGPIMKASKDDELLEIKPKYRRFFRN